MTDPAPENHVIDQGLGLMPQENQGQEAPATQESQEDTINPMWNPLLEKLPSQFHSVATPILKDWDKNYTEGMQRVHSQYAPYKPFAEQQIAPEDINNALLIYNALNANPQELVGQLVDYYKYELPTQGEQGQVDPQQQAEEEGIPYDVTQHPEFQRMVQMVELMGQNTLQQNEAVLQQQAEADIAAEFDAAKQKHGEFDETWVAQQMYLHQVDIDTAVAAWNDHVNKIVQNHRSPGSNAPVLMGGGGGLPSQQVRTGQLSDGDRRKLVAETLARNAQAQNGG